MDDKTTPTQDLILEVLIARHRLGETWWPFDSHLSRQLSGLATAGLIETKAGVVANTLQAKLSDEGVRKFIDESAYIARGFKDYADKIADFCDNLGMDMNIGKIIRRNYGSNK